MRKVEGIPGNLFDSVEGLREGTCEVMQKGANCNQKSTQKRILKVSQREIKMHQKINPFSGTRFVRTIFEERVPFWKHLVDLGSYFGGHWISKSQSAPCFKVFGAFSNKEKCTFKPL